MTEPDKKRSAGHTAIVKGIIAFVVGITCFLLLAAARRPPLIGPLVGHIEVLGVDLGLAAESFLRRVHGHEKYRYVFFDLDRGACERLRAGDAREPPSAEPACSPVAHADRRIVAAMVRAARESDARVIVLDIAAVWPGPRTGDELADALMPPPKGGRQSPVVLPLLYDRRPYPGGSAIVPLPALSGPAAMPPAANVHFGLPFGFPETGAMNDGVVRAYARSVATDTLTGRDGARNYPSLASAAACLAEAPERDQPKCDRPAETAPPAWIWYSVPPMAGSAPDSRLDRLDRLDRVHYEKASESLERVSLRFPDKPLLKDAVVIIGSSRDGRDYHATPLGRMTGAEIVLNATRSFLEFSPESDSGWFGSFRFELPIIAGTAGVFACFWFWIRRRAERHAARHAENRGRKIHAAIAGIGFVSFFCVAIGGAFLAAIMLQTTSHYDVLTPVLATTLEGTIEGMHVLIVWLEDVVDLRVDALRQALQRLRGVGDEEQKP